MKRTVETPYGMMSYEFTRKQVKNINMRVKPDGTVSVSASTRVSLSYIDGFVIEKAEFITDALKRFESITPTVPQNQVYAHGSTIFYLGYNLTLDVRGVTSVTHLQKGKLPVPHLEGTSLYVVCDEPENPTCVKEQVYAFYTQEQTRIFTILMEKHQYQMASLNIPQASLKILTMKSRWGTCHTRKHVITLNSKLILTPYSAIDYVVLHEFCHFIHANHSKEFYGLVAQYMPDWKVQREELKKWSCQ